tara:strand:- start:560 stop:748 length:189 start_codon:yes stop_codon:yes gene_type:complete
MNSAEHTSVLNHIYQQLQEISVDQTRVDNKIWRLKMYIKQLQEDENPFLEFDDDILEDIAHG